MISSGQIRAARGFLNWNQSKLAEYSKLSVQTIKRMETKGTGSSTAANVQAVLSALEAAGCSFLADDGNGEGVRAKGG